MKISKLYKYAIILILVVFAISVSVEEADSRRRRRRKIACNTTATILIWVTFDDRKQPNQKKYQFNKSGSCGVRSGWCQYVGTQSAKALFDEWRRSYAADANRLANCPNNDCRYMRPKIILEAVCQGREKFLGAHDLKWVGGRFGL